MMQTLTGIRVLDLTQIYQGPYASFLMAMAGADVVKVEPLGGERTRRGGGKDTPLSFVMLNSNKRSLALDLKHERGKALFKSLAERADVVLENFAPGVMDRLGIGYEVLRQLNPRLVYGSATGYGLSGPDRDQLAMDHTIQAVSGIMSLTGEQDGPPLRAGGTPCDIMGGIHLYAGVMEALLARERTGRGTLVEVAMIETMYFTLTSDLAYLASTGELPKRRGDRTNATATPYSRYPCKDGWLALICVAEMHWVRILEVIGRADLIGNPDFEGNPKRYARAAEINAMITAWSETQTLDEAMRAMREKKIPSAPVRTIDVVRDDPHMHERGMLKRMVHPYLGEMVLPRSPIRMSAFEMSELAFFPEPGADKAAVLGDWLAMAPDEVEALEAAGVI
jgi:CoA:oxalate CoA-transferase